MDFVEVCDTVHSCSYQSFGQTYVRNDSIFSVEVSNVRMQMAMLPNHEEDGQQ
jgi:hypothetical protein